MFTDAYRSIWWSMSFIEKKEEDKVLVNDCKNLVETCLKSLAAVIAAVQKCNGWKQIHATLLKFLFVESFEVSFSFHFLAFTLVKDINSQSNRLMFIGEKGQGVWTLLPDTEYECLDQNLIESSTLSETGVDQHLTEHSIGFLPLRAVIRISHRTNWSKSQYLT